MPLDRDQGGTDDQPMTALVELLTAAHDSGMSYDDMARNARKQGHKVSKQYFNMVATGRIKRPSLERLAALAAGLPGVTESQVREAAARSAGVHVERNITYQTSQLLGFVEDMAPANRDRWFRLSQAIARELAEEEKTGAPRTVITTDTGERPSGMIERRTNQELDAAEQRAFQGQERRRRRG